MTETVSSSLSLYHFSPNLHLTHTHVIHIRMGEVDVHVAVRYDVLVKELFFFLSGMSETSLTVRHGKKKLVISRLTERTENSISLFLQREQAREQTRAQQFP